MLDTVLFDLDGTLTDPAEGITNCVRYAIEKAGLAPLTYDKLLSFIGPPLVDSFMYHYPLDRGGALRCVEFYRERFTRKGIYENVLYNGTRDMLRGLDANGKTLILATSKPHIYAKRILEHFDILHYFSHICGPELDGTHNEKSEVIALALEYTGDRRNTVMVGDRRYDIEGAHKNGIRAVGVEFGYAVPGELKDAGAEYTVYDTDGLYSLLSRL